MGARREVMMFCGIYCWRGDVVSVMGWLQEMGVNLWVCDVVVMKG